jgi:hypothetical protein
MAKVMIDLARTVGIGGAEPDQPIQPTELAPRRPTICTVDTLTP